MEPIGVGVPEGINRSTGESNLKAGKRQILET